MRKFNLIIILFVLVAAQVFTQNTKRWALSNNQSISWEVTNNIPHTDNIEMSGLHISAIIHYGISDSGELLLTKKLVFPMLRTIPNDTHASLIADFDKQDQLQISVDGLTLHEYPESFNLKGKLTVSSRTNTQLKVTRTVFPSVDKPALFEIVKLKNNGKASCSVDIINNSVPIETDPAKGVYGKYIVTMDVNKTNQITIAPDEELCINVVYSGRKQSGEIYSYSADYELNKREHFVNDIFNSLVLETPNDTINREFAFAKIRAAESIYETKGGLMHGPGGEAYYAAIWAND